jgi:hypothetical protein
VELHAAFTDVSNGKRGVVDKSERTFSYLEPTALSPFTAIRHVITNQKSDLALMLFPWFSLREQLTVFQHQSPAVCHTQLEINRTQHEYSNHHAWIHQTNVLLFLWRCSFCATPIAAHLQ